MEEIDIDDIIHQLQRTVETRRLSGDYPLGLEEQLEAEFDLIMAAVQRREVDTGGLEQILVAVRTALAAIGTAPPDSSRVPGGSIVHRSSGRLVRRHTSQLADELRRFGDGVAGALDEIRALVEAQRSADQRQLVEVLASLHDRLAVIDHLAASVVDIERRLGVVELQSGEP